MSQHLRELGDAGLIQGAVDGVKVCYCLDPAVMQQVREAFAGFLDDVTAAAAAGDDTVCVPPDSA